MKKTSWGSVASWYDDLLENTDDSYQKNVIMPNLIRIVEPKKGQKILDIACGQGYFARAFAQNGAEVSACDISKELIEIAKKNSKNPINYFVAPADKIDVSLLPQDCVTIVLALQNIENLNGVIEQCKKILKPGGRLIFVLNHPAFRNPGKSHWEWNEETKAQYRKIEAYMSDSVSRIDMTPGIKEENKKRYTVSFHRPLQSYSKTLNKHGFAINRMEEWISHKKSQEGPRQKEEDRMRKEIPMFLLVEATLYQ